MWRRPRKFAKFIKDICGVDPDARGTDAIPSARLFTAWESCKKRNEVETEQTAHRAVQNLPPTVSADDFQAAREAWEQKAGKTYPDHKIPSENFFEKKVGEVEGSLKADRLTNVASLAQEERQKTPMAAPWFSIRPGIRP